MKRILLVMFILGSTMLIFVGCKNGGKPIDPSILEEHSNEITSEEIDSTDSPSTSQATINSSEHGNIIFLTKNITGLSGKVYQLSLPLDWKEEVDPKSQNEALEFMLSAKNEQLFVACIVEDKRDFSTLNAYTQLVSERLNSTNNVAIAFREKKINDIPIRVSEFATEIQGAKLTYIYYIIETETSYVQLYGWTFTRLFEESNNQLTSILNSFKEK